MLIVCHKCPEIRTSLHCGVGKGVSRGLEAEHHDVARIGLGGPEQGVGAMEAVQNAQNSKTVVESARGRGL